MQYAALVDKVGVLIIALGRPVTLRQTLNVGFANPSEPWAGYVPKENDFSVSAVFSDFEETKIDGTTVHAGDKLALIAAKGLTITPGLKDSVVDGGTTWRIVSAVKTEPGGVVIVHELHLRQ